MAGSPKWKIFDSHGNYQAACKEIEAAAALIGFYGEGATIRFDHANRCTVWTEGHETQEAHISFDHVADVASKRELMVNAKALKKAHGAAWVRDALRKLGHDEETITAALDAA